MGNNDSQSSLRTLLLIACGIIAFLLINANACEAKQPDSVYKPYFENAINRINDRVKLKYENIAARRQLIYQHEQEIDALKSKIDSLNSLKEKVKIKYIEVPTKVKQMTNTAIQHYWQKEFTQKQ